MILIAKIGVDNTLTVGKTYEVFESPLGYYYIILDTGRESSISINRPEIISVWFKTVDEYREEQLQKIGI